RLSRQSRVPTLSTYGVDNIILTSRQARASACDSNILTETQPHTLESFVRLTLGLRPTRLLAIRSKPMDINLLADVDCHHVLANFNRARIVLPHKRNCVGGPTM